MDSMEEILPLCVFCLERKTKYSCVVCNEAACNICTNPAPDHCGYDEENKRVGICQKCVVMDPNAGTSESYVDADTSVNAVSKDEVKISKIVSNFMPGPSKKRNKRH